MVLVDGLFDTSNSVDLMSDAEIDAFASDYTQDEILAMQDVWERYASDKNRDLLKAVAESPLGTRLEDIF